MVFDEQGGSQNVSWSSVPEEGKGIGIFLPLVSSFQMNEPHVVTRVGVLSIQQLPPRPLTFVSHNTELRGQRHKEGTLAIQ